MATIQLILNAVNNASKGILAVATSAQAAADSVDALNGKIADLDTALATQTVAATAAAARLNDLASAGVKAAAGQTAAAVAGRGLRGAWGWMAGPVPLFGGLLTIGAWHAVADAVVEFGTTIVQAGIAVVAFGALAAPTFQHISVQLHNIWTASNALNTSIYPLQSSFAKLGQAVAPEAYQLYGEALVAVNSHLGEFQQLAAASGRVLDQLGARLVAAITNGNGFSSFILDGTRSLGEWGNILGNVGGILGNVFRALPGYANILAHALEGLTGALEAVTSSGIVQFMLNAGLAVHGFIVWAGLAATGAILLGRAMISLGKSFLATDLVAFLQLLVQIRSVEEGMALLSMVNPFVWVGIAAAAVAGLIVLLRNSNSEAQQFNQSMQQLVSNAPITTLNPTIFAATIKTTQELSDATRQLAAAQKEVNAVTKANMGDTPRYANALLQGPLQAVSQYEQGLHQLDQQQQTFDTHLSQLTRMFGGSTQAWGLLTAAGITSSQMLTTNSEQWAQVIVQMKAVQDANASMILGWGRNAAAMNALNYAGDTTNNVLGSLDADMTKIVQGMDGITSVVLGGEQALVGYEQAVNTLNTNFKAAGGYINGVSQASVQLSSDFYTGVLPSIQKTIDAMEMQLPTTRQLTTAIATMTSQQIPWVRGNTAAQAVIVSLINNALGPGTVSLQNWQKWASSNATTMAGLNQIIGQTTTQASVLANTLGSDMNAQFAQNILKVTGAQQALSQYTADLVNNTQNTAAGQGDRATLIADLVQAGLSAQQAQTYVDGLATALGKVQSPPPVTITVVGMETGNFQALSLAGQLAGGAAIGIYTKHASGGLISGPGTKTSDSVPALLSAGEYVMRAASVDKYGKHMMDLINSNTFAAGGLVTPYGGLANTLGAAMTGAIRHVPGFAAGGPVAGESPLSLTGMTLSGPVTVTGQSRVEQLLADIADTLDQVAELLAAAPGATAAATAAAGNGRSAAYQALYSTRG